MDGVHVAREVVNALCHGRELSMESKLSDWDALTDNINFAAMRPAA